MKSITTFLTIILLSVGATQAKASQLYLRTNSGGYTMIQISGDVFHTRNGQAVINNLRPGNHRIQVSRKMHRSHRPYRNNRGYRYREFNHRADRQVIYRGRIHIPPRSTVYARINPRGRLIIEEVIRHRNKRRSPNRGNRDWDRDYDRDWDRDRDNRRDDRRPRRGGNYGNEAAFGQALALVQNASFESEKQAIAKQFVQTNGSTSRQVLEFARAMDFESSRLKFAKYAYDHTFDPENYYLVNQAFDFSSSTTALNRYIN